MPTFIGRRPPRPRLAPELDDKELGRVLKTLVDPHGFPVPGIQIDLISTLVAECGEDWDRRSHRLSVLSTCLPNALLAASWLARAPNSADALILHGWMALRDASATGGVPDESGILEDCYQAVRLRPRDPAPWVLMLGVMRRQRRPFRQVRPIWGEILARDPWHRQAHLEMLGYLSPAEQGSHVAVLDFIDSRTSQMPAGAPPSGLKLIVEVQRYQKSLGRGGLEEIIASSHWNTRDAASSLEWAQACWLQPGFLRHASAVADLNLLAFALIASRRFADAATAFRAVKGIVTPWPWHVRRNPVEEFATWQTRCWR
ncbi:hypothetical protein ACFU96_47335 [Streptomyces sp. NPDC057620]|uniref:hypothetical protein n=1 Tax=Streptomyces sp. NPDC057620 TaxID=3346185 RepID=UPI0036C0579E